MFKFAVFTVLIIGVVALALCSGITGQGNPFAGHSANFIGTDKVHNAQYVTSESAKCEQFGMTALVDSANNVTCVSK